MARPNVEKATVFLKDKGKSAGGLVVECQFNPTEFEMTRAVKWVEEEKTGDNASKLTFGGGVPQELSIPLLFDSTATGKDVRDSYKALFEMSMIDKEKKDKKTQMGEPPICIFQWGKLLSFMAVIESISQKFTLFKNDGTPLRAQVTVKFKQVDEKMKPQNPTSYSGAQTTRIVLEGETLAWIAYQEYGDASQWRHLAETNNLDNPLALQAGQILKITPLP